MFSDWEGRLPGLPVTQGHSAEPAFSQLVWQFPFSSPASLLQTALTRVSNWPPGNGLGLCKCGEELQTPTPFRLSPNTEMHWTTSKHHTGQLQADFT